MSPTLAASTAFASLIVAGCSLPHASAPQDSRPTDTVTDEPRVDVDVTVRDVIDDPVADREDVMGLDVDDASDVADASDASDGSLDADVRSEAGDGGDAADTSVDSGDPVDSGRVDSGVCAAGLTACGPGIGCVDTTTSLDHCGRCNSPVTNRALVCRRSTALPPLDCADLLRARPSSVSSVYAIDPDDDSVGVNVFCDMATAEGGWTVVYSNLGASFASDVEASRPWNLPPALSMRSNRMLVAFRAADGAAERSSAAVSALPTEFRAAGPFVLRRLVLTNFPVSVNGVARMSTLRVGADNFSDSDCGGGFTAGSWGKFCFDGTAAPFFASWATGAADGCSTSDMLYSSTPCGPTRQFTIAVAP